jgi:hypothetical protein
MFNDRDMKKETCRDLHMHLSNVTVEKKVLEQYS